MAMKAKHAFGNLADVEKALQAGKIDSYDILFLDGDTEPKIGWIDAKGVFRLVENEADFSELEKVIATKADAAKVEAELAMKADVADVETAISNAVASTTVSANAYTDKMVEAAMGEHLTKRYEIVDVPVGTLVDYRENEIRVMCPENSQWSKQSVGVGGDPNVYYATFKTYAPSDDVVGYIEHLGGQVDKEVLTDFSVDEYGRRYQPTWLGLARHDGATDTWTYYGKNSTVDKYIGWDYRIDWYNADGIVIASDCVRINLSNEGCHHITKAYYVNGMLKEVETMIDEKIIEVEAAYEVIEF